MWQIAEGVDGNCDRAGRRLSDENGGSKGWQGQFHGMVGNEAERDMDAYGE